jgi:hypothetical protein
MDRLASGAVETAPIELPPEEIRAQHIWIPGLPGYGKSTLLHAMAVKDIREGKGLTIIDPAGDLVGNGLPDDPDRHIPGIIDWIPQSRIGDTIYLDLKQPVPIDFFSYADDDEKQIVASNLVDLFTRLSEMFGGQPGVRFGGIVREIIYTLFEAGDTSFIDIYDFIKDPDRRKEILGRVSEKTRAQWDRFPNDEKTEPIISRLTPIAKNPRLRTIFGTPNAKLKFSEVMDDKSIVLVNIAGASEAGIVLGTMIISQLMQAALKRSELAKHRRIPHHVYVDEFQNFQVGTDMARILTQCRKYNLCLTIANQYTAQIGDIAASLIGSAIMSYIQLKAFERKAEKRTECTIIVDEFQNFCHGVNWTTFFAELRKYDIRVWLATQSITQVPEKWLDPILTNASNVISFAAGDKDAERLVKVFGGQTTEDHLLFMDDRVFCAKVKDGVHREFYPDVKVFPPAAPRGDESYWRDVLKTSRMRWGKNRKDVDKGILKLLNQQN